MTPMKMIAFVDELTKTAKPRGLGTMLGQNVTKTVKAKAKGLAKKAGSLGLARLARIAKARGKLGDKMSRQTKGAPHLANPEDKAKWRRLLDKEQTANTRYTTRGRRGPSGPKDR